MLGLAAFLLIALSVILVARKTVVGARPEMGAGRPVRRRRRPSACSSLATLYDVMAVPHGTCVFLYLAGLAVVVAGPGRGAAAAGARATTRAADPARRARARPATLSRNGRSAPADAEVRAAASRVGLTPWVSASASESSGA